MVPTNFQQKSVRVVHAQFVPRYVWICLLASKLTARRARFRQKKQIWLPRYNGKMKDADV